MRIPSIWSVVLGPALIILLSSVSQGQESPQEDFKEFCQVLKGRFTAKITWAIDWEPFAKKGDQTTAYWEARLAEDDHMLIGKCLIGKGSDTSFMFYHPGSRQIKTVWVDTDGGAGESMTFKKGDKWVQLWNYTKPDGRKVKMTCTLTVTDNGNTHTWHRMGENEKGAFEATEVWYRASDK
ncbi:MAG: hypothetical protein JXM70_24565 [Pirellulales bacterium]|nr:hypothetical protein [Pirellulales bacterium]